MYSIKKYTRDRLKLLNDKLDSNSITIKVSNVKNKKIDVFINGKKTNSIGDNRYMDYPSYIIENGKEYADERRDLYFQRHSKEADIKDGKITNSWWAKYLLWTAEIITLSVYLYV
jgi:hypothetical protein